MRYQAALFDFDGTLSPSLSLWRQAFKLTLAAHGVAISDADIITRCFYKDWGVVCAEFGLGPTPDFAAQIEAHLHEVFQAVELFPFSRENLLSVRELGLKTALVSSGLQSVLSRALPQLLIHELFDFVLTGCEVKNHKPHPEPIERTLKVLQCSPQDAIMIGDSTADILAGKAAGTKTALFLPEIHREFYCFDTLRATQPDIIFSDHRELPHILGLPGSVPFPGA